MPPKNYLDCWNEAGVSVYVSLAFVVVVLFATWRSRSSIAYYWKILMVITPTIIGSVGAWLAWREALVVLAKSSDLQDATTNGLDGSISSVLLSVAFGIIFSALLAIAFVAEYLISRRRRTLSPS